MRLIRLLLSTSIGIATLTLAVFAISLTMNPSLKPIMLFAGSALFLAGVSALHVSSKSGAESSGSFLVAALLLTATAVFFVVQYHGASFEAPVAGSAASTIESAMLSVPQLQRRWAIAACTVFAIALIGLGFLAKPKANPAADWAVQSPSGLTDPRIHAAVILPVLVVWLAGISATTLIPIRKPEWAIAGAYPEMLADYAGLDSQYAAAYQYLPESVERGLNQRFIGHRVDPRSFIPGDVLGCVAPTQNKGTCFIAYRRSWLLEEGLLIMLDLDSEYRVKSTTVSRQIRISSKLLD